MKDYNPNWANIVNLAKKEGVELGVEQGVRLGLKFAARIAGLSWDNHKFDRIARIIAGRIRSADPSVVRKYFELNHE